MRYLLMLLLGQWVLALFYAIHAKRKQIMMPVEKIAITAFIPLFGIVIPYFGFVFKTKETFDLNELFEHGGLEFKNDVRYLKRANLENEMNAVPVEEALILNDDSIKKRLIVDTAKEDAYDYISFLKLAIRDSDVETSHYAASIVMEVNRKLMNLIQEQSVAYSLTPEDDDCLKRYLETIQKYYHSQLLDERSLIRYRYLYNQLLDEWLRRGYREPKWLEEKIQLSKILKNANEELQWIEVYKTNHPESERPYLLLMMHYYDGGNRELLDETLVSLRNSPVKLSQQGLGIVRFWMSGEESEHDKQSTPEEQKSQT